MESEITGRNIKVGKELRRVVEEGLSRIEPFTGKGATAHVVLSARKNIHIAEVTVNARQRRLIGMAEASDPAIALRTALEKTEKQAIRWKKTKVERKRQSASVRTALSDEAEAPAPDERRNRQKRGNGAKNGEASVAHIVFAMQSVVSRRMAVEEAVKEAESSAEPVLVFRDLGGDLKVLYCTGDGRVRVIEVAPE